MDSFAIENGQSLVPLPTHRITGIIFEICNQNAEKLVSLGKAIKEAASEQITVQHPEFNELNSIEYTMFVEKSLPQIKTSTILYPGRVDRSPCGTGTSAQLAALIAKGDVNSNQRNYIRVDYRWSNFLPNTKKTFKMWFTRCYCSNHARASLDIRQNRISY